VRGSSDGALHARVALMLCAALVGLGSWLAVRGHTQPRLDRIAFDLLALPTSGWAADAASSVVDIAEVVLAACAVGVIGFLLVRRAWRDCIVIVIGVIASQTAAHIAKSAIARPRPTHGLVPAGGYSFPSTTSALGVSFLFMAIALARVVPQRYRRMTVSAGAAITLVLGLSFVALRVHYLTDVLAGWALGLLVFVACETAASAISEPRIGR
jgi:membrane-associated phospholipid phosphatase